MHTAPFRDKRNHNRASRPLCWTFNSTRNKPLSTVYSLERHQLSRDSLSRRRRRLLGNNLAKPHISLTWGTYSSRLMSTKARSHHRFGWNGRCTGSYYFLIQRLNGSWSEFQGPFLPFCSCHVTARLARQSGRQPGTLLIDIYTLTQEDPGKRLAQLGLVGFGKWEVRRYYYCTMRQLSESGSEMWALT